MVGNRSSSSNSKRHSSFSSGVIGGLDVLAMIVLPAGKLCVCGVWCGVVWVRHKARHHACMDSLANTAGKLLSSASTWPAPAAHVLAPVAKQHIHALHAHIQHKHRRLRAVLEKGVQEITPAASKTEQAQQGRSPVAPHQLQPGVPRLSCARPTLHAHCIRSTRTSVQQGRPHAFYQPASKPSPNQLAKCPPHPHPSSKT